MRRLVSYLLLVMLSGQLHGQLSGNNLFEFQLGNLPDTRPSDLTTHYNQLNLKYRYKFLNASIRYEHFLSPADETSYQRLSQYQLQYRKNGLDVKIGNFSEILGNGLLLRAYEIPGSVYEDQGYRVRYGFYKDIRGVSAKYQGKHVYVKALRGNVLTNELPPVLPESSRRTDLVEAIESGISYYGQTAGLIVMRNNSDAGKEGFYSLLAKGGFMSYFAYNFEFAHNLEAGISPFNRDDPASRYGLYSSVNFSLGSFGVSFEYKNFERMLIGSGISDPPTLVKEHKYKVLNRSIHVPKFSDEQGIQAEAYYSFESGSRLLINYARAINEFTSTYIFSEIFTEYTFFPGKSSITVFADYASDEFKLEPGRYSTGGIWELELKNSWSTLLELEYQHITREGFLPAKVNNMVIIAGVSHSPKTSWSIVSEISDDPRLVSGDSPRLWLGANFSFKIDMHNTLSVFAGQRRGGPACTSGICYEVLDFQGVELRFKSKFLSERVMKKQILLIVIVLFIAAGVKVKGQNEGDTAPDFTVDLLGGGSFTLSNQKGNVVLVYFFGNGCPYCVESGPLVQGLYSSYKDDPNFVAVGLDTWDSSSDEESVTNFRNNTGITFPLALNANSVKIAYNTTHDRIMVIDKNGIIRRKANTAAINDIQTASGVISSLLTLTGFEDMRGANRSVSVYPVPASESLFASFYLENGSDVHLVISDITGRTRKNSFFTLGAGPQNLSLDLHGLEQGIYLYTFRIENRVEAGKFAIQ